MQQASFTKLWKAMKKFLILSIDLKIQLAENDEFILNETINFFKQAI